jgi:hypothetical protein
MDSLPAMLAQRPILERAGVSFEPISNHETLWTIASVGTVPPHRPGGD